MENLDSGGKLLLGLGVELGLVDEAIDEDPQVLLEERLADRGG